jgi:hypothetical protein
MLQFCSAPTQLSIGRFRKAVFAIMMRSVHRDGVFVLLRGQCSVTHESFGATDTQIGMNE